MTRSPTQNRAVSQDQKVHENSASTTCWSYELIRFDHRIESYPIQSALGLAHVTAVSDSLQLSYNVLPNRALKATAGRDTSFGYAIQEISNHSSVDVRLEGRIWPARGMPSSCYTLRAHGVCVCRGATTVKIRMSTWGGKKKGLTCLTV